MKVIKVQHRITGIRKILKGREATAELARRANRGAQAAGDGFGFVVKPGRYTARAFVQTEDETGEKRQSEEAVLERVLGSMR